MTLGDALVAYLFWIWTKSSYGIETVQQYFFEKRKRKLSKRFGFDEEQYEKVQSAIEVMQKRLRELK
jgi:hypothetical protein